MILLHVILSEFFKRYAALETTTELLPCIGEAIQTMLDEADYRGDETKADSLKSAIMKFDFIYTLVVVTQIMSVTKDLCIKLQGTGILNIILSLVISKTYYYLHINHFFRPHITTIHVIGLTSL